MAKYLMDKVRSVRLQPIQIFNQYKNNSKVKVKWNKVMCSMDDYFDTYGLESLEMVIILSRTY